MQAGISHNLVDMMQELLLTIWNDLKLTVIFVTHDIEEALFPSLICASLPFCSRFVAELACIAIANRLRIGVQRQNPM
jgi:ABC-type nitrate/sulfonate/bicarbonate transport system ATPase subunit